MQHSVVSYVMKNPVMWTDFSCLYTFWHVLSGYTFTPDILLTTPGKAIRDV